MLTNYKKMTKSGALNIPAAIRRDLGIEHGDPLVIDEHEGTVRIRPYLPRCTFCGSQEGVALFHGKGICGDCGRRAVKLLEQKGV